MIARLPSLLALLLGTAGAADPGTTTPLRSVIVAAMALVVAVDRLVHFLTERSKDHAAAAITSTSAAQQTLHEVTLRLEALAGEHSNLIRQQRAAVPVVAAGAFGTGTAGTSVPVGNAGLSS